jgi:DNA polymerase-3 subunit gamma/tau
VYQALYRKWRPQTFDQVVGQKHITETLKNQVKTGRLSHAYIFIGTRGTGKTTCARILARAVNCENPVDGNPCGKCAACRGILDGSVMDVVELDAASNNGVENVRALREEAVFSPTTVKKRVYIIDEVHMLSNSAFNALLKILEEPPAHLMFILATTELQKVPATILSRCQRHSFRRIDTPEIAEYLEYIAKQENLNLSHEAAELIARLAEGGVRDALSLLDQCSAQPNIDVEAVYSSMGLAGNRRIAQLLNLILEHDTEAALKEFNALWMDGKDPVTLLGELAGLVRDSMMFHVAPKGAMELISGSYDGATLKSFADRLTTDEMLAALETLQKSVAAMKDTKNPKLSAELCIVSMCESAAGDSVAELKARISRLEATVQNGVPVRTAAPAPVSAPAAPIREQERPPIEEYEELYPPQPSYRDEPEYEELDPMDYAEEQPEDSFLQRSDKAAPPEPVEPVVPDMSDAELWAKVCEKAKPTLPVDTHIHLGDSNTIKAYMANGVLHLNVKPGFIFGRFNKPEIVAKISAAATAVRGVQTNVLVSEMKAEEPKAASRSIEDLKKFKEVRFI